MVNYANSKVYKIWSTQGDKIYVGSTTKQYLSQRMDNHRRCYRAWKNETYHFVSSYILFDEYGLQNCFIELLETKECKSKDELHQLEGKYIRELECVNKCIAGRTVKEYREDNKEQISEQRKHYREKTKENITQKNKQYYEAHTEQFTDYQKQYRENNKEKISERRSQQNSCGCGGKYTLMNKAVHYKTMRHCQYIESQTIKPEVYEV